MWKLIYSNIILYYKTYIKKYINIKGQINFIFKYIQIYKIFIN